MWHNAPNAGQTHGAVSVVTTVYPGVPAFAGPPQSYNTSATHPGGANIFASGGHAPQQASPYVGQPGSISKTSSTSSNYGPDGGSYGSHDVQHHQGYPGHGQVNDFGPSAPRHAVALNAAAQAAAAAVATATATATAVAIDQSQFQNFPQVTISLTYFSSNALLHL